MNTVAYSKSITKTFSGKPVKSFNMNTHIYSSMRFFLSCVPTRTMDSSLLRFLDHTQQHTTACRTALDERSARRRDLYLTTNNTHKKQTSLPPAGFEPTISAGERTQNVFSPRNHWDWHSSISFVIEHVVHIAVKKFFEFQRNARYNAVIKRLNKETSRKSG